MNDIFISYAREDKECVSALTAALKKQGWSVWSDSTIRTGEKFSQVIEEALTNSSCVIVVWSKYSVVSDWVVAEASEARRRNTLIPIFIDDCVPPLIFRQLQTANFAAWDGDDRCAVFQQLVSDISNLLGKPSSVTQEQLNDQLAADLARRSVEIRRQVLEREPDEEGYYWWYLMKNKDRRKLLELSVLLAIESLHISASAEAEQALRDSLVWHNRPIAKLNYDGYRSSTLDFAPDGSCLATTSDKNTVRIWDANNWQEIKRLRHNGRVRALQFHPNGRILATGDERGIAHLWDIATGEELYNMTHKGEVWDISFNHDGTLLGTATLDHYARLWSTVDGAQIMQFAHPVEKVTRIVFSPIENTLFTLCEDGIVRHWNLKSGEKLADIEHIGVAEITITPDGKYLATASTNYSDASIRLWDTKSLKERVCMEHDSGVESVRFSPDGNYLASASHDGTARLWEMPSGKEVARLKHTDRVITVVFSHDGAYLATGCQGDGAIVWKVPSGEAVARLISSGNSGAIVFSPDDKFAITSSDSSSAYVWCLPIDDLVEEACKRLTRNLTSDEWSQYLGKQPYRRTCPGIPL